MARKKILIDVEVNSKGAEKEINGIEQALTKIGKAAAGLVALEKLKDAAIYAAKTADQFTALEGRLEDTMEGFGNLQGAMESIKRISSETGAGIQTVGKLFESVAESAKNAGKSSADAEKLVETLSRIKTAYNIDNTGFSNAMMQFNQALSAGVLRGEEFNSVMENAGPVMREMAKGLGVNVSHMRQLAEAGALTNDRIFQLSSQLPAMIEKMEKAPKTINTEWGKIVSQIDQSIISLNEMYGITEKIANVMSKISGFMAKNSVPHEKRTYDPEDWLERSRFIANRPSLEDRKAAGEKTGVPIRDAIRDHNLSAEMAREQAEQEMQKQAEIDKNKKAQEQANADALLKAPKEEDLEKDMWAGEANRLDSKIEEMRAQEARKKEIQDQAEEEYKQSLERRLSAEKLSQEQSENEYAQSLARRKAAQEAANEADINENYRFSGALTMIDSVKNQSLETMDETTKKNLKTNMKKSGMEILNAAGEYSKKMFEVSKSANLADTIIQGYKAVQIALGAAPPPLNFALAAIVAGQAAIQVRGIQAQKYGGGGSFTPSGGGAGGGASSQGFGAISEKFGDKEGAGPKKQVNITIADGDIFSAKSVRELIKAIGEQVGNNLVLTTG